MGYRKQAKIYKLVFDDPELDGLEVRARSLPIGELRRFMGFSLTGGTPASQAVEALDAFARAIVSWNLEDEDGTPVPATTEGINRQEIGFILPIINAWVEAVSGAEGELGKGSDSGGPSLEASLPMEPLSPSLAS